MDIAAVLEEIKYKPGFLRRLNGSTTGDGDHPFREDETVIPPDASPVFVVRFEPVQNALLVRNETDPFHLEDGSGVELIVPQPLALMRMDGQVLQTEFVRDRVQIFALRINGMRMVRLRNERRFEERLPARFISLPGYRSVLAIGEVAEGRVINLSLGGMKLLTDEELPIGFEGEFDVRTFAGMLHLVGRVVHRSETPAGRTYGIKFLEFDGITDRLLRQHLYAQERRLRTTQNDELGFSNAPGTSTRSERSRVWRRWGR